MVNPKKLFAICVALAFATCVSAANTDEMYCRTEQRFKDGEVRTVDLRLILEKDRIIGLICNDVDYFAASNNIFACSVDTTIPDIYGQPKWSGTVNKTILELTEKESRDKSLVRIEKHGNGYKVTFVQMSRFYCGNSEFPESIVIQKGNGQCNVVYRKEQERKRGTDGRERLDKVEPGDQEIEEDH